MATQTDPDVAHNIELRHRLPTLSEVLGRRTLSPVDLFSFYIYMRDIQRSVDYLDFWLDVTQHMTLCRHFVAELRRSVLYETPDLEKTTSKRSSQILDTFEDPSELNARSNSMRSEAAEKSIDLRVSAFLRNDRTEPNNSSGSRHGHKESGDSSHSQSRSRPNTAGRPQTSGTGAEQPPRPSFMSSNFGASPNDSSPGQDSTPAHHTVTRQDLRSSAEKILYTYLLEGAEREIVLPPSILNDVVQAIEEDGRDDPEVFATAREYVFQAMERDAFPGFLRSKALGNLVPPSILLRLVIGLLGMFGGFWAAFVLIFLDKDRATRCWVILPFAVGVYYLACHQYTLDPFLALAGYSEQTFFHFSKVREPFVRSLLAKRSLIALIWITIITAALVCLLSLFLASIYECHFLRRTQQMVESNVYLLCTAQTSRNSAQAQSIPSTAFFTLFC